MLGQADFKGRTLKTRQHEVCGDCKGLSLKKALAVTASQLLPADCTPISVHLRGQPCLLTHLRHGHTRTDTHKYTHTNTYKYTCTDTHTHRHTQIHPHKHIQMHMHRHTRTHTHCSLLFLTLCCGGSTRQPPAEQLQRTYQSHHLRWKPGKRQKLGFQLFAGMNETLIFPRTHFLTCL